MANQSKKVAICVQAIVRIADSLGIDVSKLTRDRYLKAKRVDEPSTRTLNEAGGFTRVKKFAMAMSNAGKGLVNKAEEVFPYEKTDDSGPVVVGGVPTTKRYIITWAQNATGLDDNFWASLLQYIKHTGAELKVIYGRYHNPTSLFSERAKKQDVWDERTVRYRMTGRVMLAPDLMVCGDVPIQPTAVTPLTGFERFAGIGSTVLGHPKQQLKAIASTTRGDTKVFASTGACTVKNYIPAKAGAKASGHHIIGALVVEVLSDGRFFIRQINAEPDGSFIDLNTQYEPMGVSEAKPAAALVMGDIHCPLVDDSVVEATFVGASSILSVLNPKNIILHDVLDFRARNHHNRNRTDDMFERFAGAEENIVEDEVQQAVEFLDFIPKNHRVIVVQSNHDEAFDRWLQEADPKSDPMNARFFYEMNALRTANFEMNPEWLPALALYYQEHGNRDVQFLLRNENFIVERVECGFHGDKGLNGTKSTVLTYAKLGVKSVIGHFHSPQILDGTYVVGITGDLDQKYNGLPSSWMHAHCVIYANGKRSLLFISGGDWRG